MDSNRILHITSNDQHKDDHLADKLGVVDDVELLPGEELLAAHEAGEALQVEHLAMQLQQKEDGKVTLSSLSTIIPIIHLIIIIIILSSPPCRGPS